MDSEKVRPAPVICGTVKTTTGSPLSGVMVVGTDLNYAETDAEGRFEIKSQDKAVVCWCTGFFPQPVVACGGTVEVTLRAVGG